MPHSILFFTRETRVLIFFKTNNLIIVIKLHQIWFKENILPIFSKVGHEVMVVNYHKRL